MQFLVQLYVHLPERCAFVIEILQSFKKHFVRMTLQIAGSLAAKLTRRSFKRDAPQLRLKSRRLAPRLNYKILYGVVAECLKNMDSRLGTLFGLFTSHAIVIECLKESVS